MRVLLLHPEDSPRRGLWSEQRWDLIVDLGRSSAFSAAQWAEQARCPLLRADSFRRGVDDLKRVRELFSAGRGRLLDEEGIDWWDLTSVLVVFEAEAALVLQRLALEIGPAAEIWATRPDWPVSLMSVLLRRSLRSFSVSLVRRRLTWAKRYANLLRRFSGAQIREIFLDKYDSEYAWRSRFARRLSPLAQPHILLPSAYGNASRMAIAYARLLPDQSFLLVTTRQSAAQCELPSNVRMRDLAGYVDRDEPTSKIAAILAQWGRLQTELSSIREFEVLLRAGVFNSFSRWVHDGFRARNAWREVLEREPVSAVLCGDDSNLYTRLPVMLAARRNIPTVDFHHGAMDGRYLLKHLPCDVYLAKNEMESDYLTRVCALPSQKIALGAPSQDASTSDRGHQPTHKTSVIFFSEPYENVGMRAQEVYGEILPALCRLARENGRDLIIKLHPFESRPERIKLVRSLLHVEDHKLVTVLDGPLSKSLLSRAWCGLTVESTTVLDCLMERVPCFLLGWLTLLPFGYVQQYTRFGVGDLLGSVGEIAEIPQRIAKFHDSVRNPQALWRQAEPDQLRQWLGAATPAAGARRVS